MERAISEMEKIRRAEEIYSRRKNGDFVYSSENENKVKNKSLYKLMFQLLFLFNIAIIIVVVQNKNYIFTEDFLKQASKYNIDIKAKVNELITYINGNEIIVSENKEDNVNSEKNLNAVETNSIEKGNVQENKSQEVIEEVEKENIVSEKVTSLSQMDIDVNEIKEKYSFILPVTGVKTSGFGVRNANEIVTKYHTGIDIANNRGTVIKSAVTGTVTQVSDVGDYGKHLRIVVDDLVTLYAHCDKIYVKEGDKVLQGQDIAEIGSTGNSTGNHLHFEIRYKNRYIDPEKIVNIGEV